MTARQSSSDRVNWESAIYVRHIASQRSRPRFHLGLGCDPAAHLPFGTRQLARRRKRTDTKTIGGSTHVAAFSIFANSRPEYLIAFARIAIEHNQKQFLTDVTLHYTRTTYRVSQARYNIFLQNVRYNYRSLALTIILNYGIIYATIMLLYDVIYATIMLCMV